MSQHEICRRLMCLTCEWGALEFRLSVETFVKQTLKIHSRVKLCTDLCPLFPQEENSSTEVGTLNNQRIFCLTTEHACVLTNYTVLIFQQHWFVKNQLPTKPEYSPNWTPTESIWCFMIPKIQNRWSWNPTLRKREDVCGLQTAATGVLITM